jgi:hypothetical protein
MQHLYITIADVEHHNLQLPPALCSACRCRVIGPLLLWHMPCCNLGACTQNRQQQQQHTQVQNGRSHAAAARKHACMRHHMVSWYACITTTKSHCTAVPYPTTDLRRVKAPLRQASNE